MFVVVVLEFENIKSIRTAYNQIVGENENRPAANIPANTFFVRLRTVRQINVLAAASRIHDMRFASHAGVPIGTRIASAVSKVNVGSVVRALRKYAK